MYVGFCSKIAVCFALCVTRVLDLENVFVKEENHTVCFYLYCVKCLATFVVVKHRCTEFNSMTHEAK